MNAEELYENMKRALNHFGLRWADKAEMEVSIQGRFIVFIYGSDSVSYKVEE